MKSEEKQYLADQLNMLIDSVGAESVLAAMYNVMSEDNLHEVLEAVGVELYGDTPHFWYGDRADYIDRNWWE